MSGRLEPGEVLGRYRVEYPVGEGGMATVLQVRHVVLGTVHALKVLHVQSPGLRERLLAEGRAQARLQHPHVVAVTDVLDVGGAPALLMELIDGGTLADVVAAAPVPLELALRLFGEVVSGVAAAHAQGLVHRDLKPANVLLALPEDGDLEDDFGDVLDGGGPELWRRATAKVTDFGLAKMVDAGLAGAADTRAVRTEAGVAMGTPAYMAPEQIRDARGVDHRADIFSLGALLYALLVGRSPFAAPDRFAVLTNVTSGRYPDLAALRPDAPTRLLELVAACLQVDPSRRVDSAETVLREVAAIRQALPAESSPGPVNAVVPGVVGGGSEATWDPAASTADDGPLESHGPRDSGVATSPAVSVAPKPEPSSRAVRGESRSATVAGLVVDESGRGHVVELVVVLTPGGAGVRSPADVDRDASVAAQLAVAAALGPQADRFGVRWAARGVGFVIHGTSLGLAIAVAARAALLGQPGPPGWAFTGGVDLDGRLVSVAGVPAKVRAAAAAGIGAVAVPVEDAASLRSVPDGVQVEGVWELSPFAERLLPSTRSGLPWRWLVLVVPVLVALLDASSAVDAWVRHPLLAAARGELAVEDVVLVAVPGGADLKTRRAEYPALITALAAGGAKAVGFDIALSTASEHDAAIAAAAAAVPELPVVLPVRLDGDVAVRPASEALLEAVALGVVEARQDAVFGHVRAIPAERVDAEGRRWWHLAVEVARAHVSARTEPTLNAGTLTVGVLQLPTFAGEVTLPPVGRVPRIDLDDVPAAAAEGRFVDKSVVVGVVDDVRDLHRTPAGVRAGAEIEAQAIETVLRQAGLRRVAVEWDALVALLVGVGMLGVARLTARWELSLVVPLGVGAVVLALGAAGIVVAPTPAVLAVVAAVWVLRAGERS